MAVFIQSPGMFTTVQDEGRLGYQQYGVSPSGPMDTLSFYLANILAGNRRTEGALEVTFTGPEIRFEEAEIFAICGADMRPMLNGAEIPMYAAVRAERGDVLKLRSALTGMRAYIAFAGGLDVPLVMGSQSTLPQKGLGGVDGRILRKGDRIGLKAPRTALPHFAERKLSAPVYPKDEVCVRAIPGPQDSAFSREELNRFFWYSAVITNQSDRQGIRLKREEPLKHLRDGNIISDGIAFGSVQVPTDGQPIVMMADRQTVGGYTKIATVISADLPKLAQARPGMKVRFVRVGVELAQMLCIKELEALNQLEERLVG